MRIETITKDVVKLDWEEVKELLPDRVSLYYVDYRDSLDDNLELLQECLKNKNFDKLYEKIDDWYVDSANIEYYLEELKADIEQKYSIDDADYIIDEYQDEIRDTLYDRDDSTILEDLLKNTSDINLRITMYSNYDCINSHWFEEQSSYSYYQTYFGAMIDTLNLNPHKVAEILSKYKVTRQDDFPNLKERNGEEYVSYEDFWQELENNSCSANNLVFITKIKASNIMLLEKETKIIIPKGNLCGIYSSWQGGGSIIEMELLKDFSVDLSKHGETEYDTFDIDIDAEGCNGYSIKTSYGIINSFYGDYLKFKTKLK